MTGLELREAQDRLGMSGLGLARWLGVSKNSVVAWRAGRTPVPGPVACAVRLLSQIETLHEEARS